MKYNTNYKHTNCQSPNQCPLRNFLKNISLNAILNVYNVEYSHFPMHTVMTIGGTQHHYYCFLDDDVLLTAYDLPLY